MDLPNPGIKPGSPALQVDSLPTELSGKPTTKIHTFKSEESFKRLLADFWSEFSSADLLFSHKMGLLHLEIVVFSGKREGKLVFSWYSTEKEKMACFLPF